MTLSYKTRQRLKGLLSVLLALAILLTAVWLVWMLWLDRYVVYTRDGARLDFSHSSRDIVGEPIRPTEPGATVSIYYNEGDNTLQSTDEMVQLTGYYITAEMLSKDFDGVLATVRKLPAGTPVMVDVKDIMGRFYYTTTLGTNLKSIDPARMDSLINELCSGGLYAIARFPAYREYLYAVDNVNHGLSSTKGQYLYWDPDRCYWLNPANSGAMTFVMQQLSEIKGMGFDEVVLADFRFPDTTEIRFSGDKTQTLIDAAANLMNTFGSDRFVLSFEVTDPGFVLPSGGRTRLYKIGCLAEEAKGVAEAAEESGVTDTAVQLVFTTELLDTRFDPYGVLRPITSASPDEE